jgi:hypothetical protein
VLPVAPTFISKIARVAQNERALFEVVNAVLDLIHHEASARRAKAGVSDVLNGPRRLTSDAEGEQKSFAARDVPTDLLHLGGVLNEPARAARDRITRGVHRPHPA